jgi:hydrogenase maturation protease
MTDGRTLVLGIGNTLLGDEGVGVAVVDQLTREGGLPSHVDLLDGGTGSLVLLDPMREAGRMILVDATADGQPPGTVRRLEPKFSSEYPASLTAHDIGLRDLLDSFYMLGDEVPQVVLFAVSIEWPQDMRWGLSPAVEAALPTIAAAVRAECLRA